MSEKSKTEENATYYQGTMFREIGLLAKELRALIKDYRTQTGRFDK